ncbi:SWIB/MDM2 domain-containing protein [Trifolium repens]|nr:SWIB/MDM2 domain-containing protein [Trifolium repens]
MNLEIMVEISERETRDTHESAEVTGSFPCLGFADSDYFGESFGYRRHTPPSCNCTHRFHCFSLILLFSDLSFDIVDKVVSGTAMRFVFPGCF